MLSINSAYIPVIELFVDFDVLSKVEGDSEMNNGKQIVLEESLNDSEDELEANYEIGDEDEDDDEDGMTIMALQGSSNQPMNQHPGDVSLFMQASNAPPTNQHPFSVPSFMFAVDFAAINGSKFA
ncbi:hypothetical protein PIB30_034427 [Stylosanthes scabra]|uniref:Uncharacterized protein n=1 Tax=Stylosanthes scabra TaxID=79078 RepID=A0ABU6RCY6_9FABA|nr:hypothetical protein [Stylosanthes scabra]